MVERIGVGEVVAESCGRNGGRGVFKKKYLAGEEKSSMVDACKVQSCLLLFSSKQWIK